MVRSRAKAMLVALLLASVLLPGNATAVEPLAASVAAAGATGFSLADPSSPRSRRALPARQVDVARLRPASQGPVHRRLAPHARILVAGAATAPVPGIATVSALLLDSDASDWVGGGLKQSFVSPSATVVASHVGTNSVTLTVTAPGHSWTANFAAAPSGTLAVGTYNGAVRMMSRGTGEPGMDIYGDGRGCNTLTGHFVVSELSWAGDGSVASFAATFEQHCEGGTPALYGEARYQSTVGWADAARPTAVDFGYVPAGLTATRTVTVESLGTLDLHLGTTAITGSDAARFSVVSDGCSGATIAPSSTCDVVIAFHPTTYAGRTYTATVGWSADTARAQVAAGLSGQDRPVPATPFAAFVGDGPMLGNPVIDGSTMDGCSVCFEPSDPVVAVSPSFVVEATNAGIRMFDRSGNLLVDAALADFFLEGPGQVFDGDPRLVWDALHGRWVAVQISADLYTSYIYLATSNTADPTGTWTVRSWYSDYYLTDYPGLGISSDKIAISTNVFDWWNGGVTTYYGTDILVVDTAQAFGTGTTAFDVFSSGPALFTARVAVNRTPATTLLIVVGIDAGPGVLHVGYLALTGGVVANTTATTSTLDLTTTGPMIPPFLDPPTPAALAGGSPPFGGIPTDATWASGVLWFPSTNGCYPAGASAQRTCGRVTAIGTGTTKTKVLDLVIGAQDLDVFVPGVTIDGAGNPMIGWSQAAAETTGPISTYVTFRRSTDPAGRLRTPTLVADGAGTYSGHRWGDYLVLAPDPIDPRMAWVNAPASTASGRWDTRAIRFEEAGAMRLAGASRFATAAAVSAATFAPGTDVAYIAYAFNFPDALAGAAAAGTVKGPVLLVNTTGPIDPSTAGELRRLQPKNIYVLGSTGVIAETVKTALQAYTSGTVTRLAGAGRFATAAAISAATFSPGVDIAYIAYAYNFPDALAGAAAAGTINGPVLLVNTTGAIDPSTAAELTRLQPKKIAVLGSTGVISDAVKTALLAYTSGAVVRLAGAGRFQTAAAISAATFSPGVDTAYIAYAYNFPDALAGAAAAGTINGPVLLANTTGALDPATIAELQRLQPHHIVVLGSTGVISDAVWLALGAYVVP